MRDTVPSEANMRDNKKSLMDYNPNPNLNPRDYVRKLPAKLRPLASSLGKSVLILQAFWDIGETYCKWVRPSLVS